MIDSGSTVNIIANKDLLHDVHKAERPISVQCNAGTVLLTEKGYLGDYPVPVWYNPKGVANIMSLNSVAKHYRVTMDSQQENAIKLHKSDGSKIYFTPSSNGLYKYALKPHETANGVWNFLIETACDDPENWDSDYDDWLLIATVKSQADKYTRRAYEGAVRARKFQNIVMRPSTRKLMDISIKHLSNAQSCGTLMI